MPTYLEWLKKQQEEREKAKQKEQQDQTTSTKPSTQPEVNPAQNTSASKTAASKTKTPTVCKISKRLTYQLKRTSVKTKTTTKSTCKGGTLFMTKTKSAKSAKLKQKVKATAAFKVKIAKGYKLSKLNVTYKKTNGKTVKLTTSKGTLKRVKNTRYLKIYQFKVPVASSLVINATFLRN